MYNAREAVSSLIPEGADTYEKVKTVYSYIIDTAEYASSEDDQNVAGIFWKKAGGVCRICRGSAVSSGAVWAYPVFTWRGMPETATQGHAWNIVQVGRTVLLCGCDQW